MMGKGVVMISILGGGEGVGGTMAVRVALRWPFSGMPAGLGERFVTVVVGGGVGMVIVVDR